MDSLNLTDFVGDVAVVTTILQSLSGILVCKEYVANKTTGDASIMPFLCGLFCSGLWCMYGCLKLDTRIIIVNIITMAMMSMYTLIFVMYTLKKFKLAQQYGVVVTLLIIIMVYIIKEENKYLLVDDLGMLASAVTLVAVAAPMVKLKHVLKVKNTECLPFPMILMSFLVCSLWTCYGALQNDLYLWGVNFIGVGLSVCQLSLFIYFPRTSNPSSPVLPKYVVH